MIHFLKTIQYKRQQTFLQHVLWNNTEQIQSYRVNKYFCHVGNYDGNQSNQFFWNFQCEHEIYFHFFPRNVSLKHYVVKILSQCLEISFMPFYSLKNNVLIVLTDLQIEIFILLFYLYFCEAVSVSPTIVCLILTILENSPYSRPIC